MRDREELVERELIARVRVPRPNGADPRILEQRHRRQTRLELRRQHREVELASREPLACARLEREEAHRDVGRTLGQRSQQRAEQQKHDVVARRHAKRPPRALGLERPPQIQQIFDLANGIVHGSREIGRERRQLEVSAHAHQELVLKCMPQTREDAAHGRLAQEQALAGARDVALVSSTSSATSKFRSNWRRFIGLRSDRDSSQTLNRGNSRSALPRSSFCSNSLSQLRPGNSFTVDSMGSGE